MVKVFQKHTECELIFSYPVTVADRELLKDIFQKKYAKVSLFFGRIYSLEREFIILLYRAIVEEKQNVDLIVYKARLAKYLRGLGFQPNYYSLFVHDKLKQITQAKQQKLLRHIKENYRSNDEVLDYFFTMVYKKYGYNLRHYKKDMLFRRLEVFAQKYQMKNWIDAIGYIAQERVFFKNFFLVFSINVTEFFRDPLVFKSLYELFEGKCKHNTHLRIWSAGCSSGEEAYSLAMLLKLAKLDKHSLIYATDFNSVVLDEAKNALYGNENLESLKRNFSIIKQEEVLESFYVQNRYFFSLSQEIREKVLFLEHNLINDASFNEFDIIICRNVLIYFELKLQESVFKLFYDSLRFGGYLVLGSSETIVAKYQRNFIVIDENYKIYKKVV